MEKIDVAIQSYKKPESLIYTLLTLHNFCVDKIDVVYIDDDVSGADTLNCYNMDEVQNALYPWKIKLRVNSKRAGIYFFTRQMLFRRWINVFWYFYYTVKKRHPVIISANDLRYQWAINSTDKKAILIIHDDIKFKKDFLKIYESKMDKNIAIVGELGQCWRCPAKNGCSPKKVINGFRPDKKWPIISGKDLEEYKQKRACRINEWCCLVNVECARKLSSKAIYFGACEDLGDTGAYWFYEAIKHGYQFDDPLLDLKDEYYQHCWQGFAGNEVWLNSNDGRHAKYDGNIIAELIKKEYTVNLR